MNLAETVIESNKCLFSDFVSLNVSAGVPYDRNLSPDDDSVAGTIDFSCKFSGYAAINMPTEMATLIASDFLFLDPGDVEEDSLRDTICEFANILGGRLKGVLDSSGSAVQISLPKFHGNTQFISEIQKNSPKMTFPFYLEEGDFFDEVQLVKS